ncbi:MAG: prolipoprotein diacylglyceryl transferase family protein, partial [Litorilinea sp.]
REELLLIFSPRPSGFEFWPGLLAGMIAGYGYLVWRALTPSHMGAALAIGLAGGGVVLEISGHLTGAILGLPTTVPWAVNYFGEQVHPVALYRAGGLVALTLALWLGGSGRGPARTMLLAALGYSLIRLLADGFLAEAQLIGPIRLSQLLALVVALASSWLLAHTSTNTSTNTDMDTGTGTPPTPRGKAANGAA